MPRCPSEGMGYMHVYVHWAPPPLPQGMAEESFSPPPYPFNLTTIPTPLRKSTTTRGTTDEAVVATIRDGHHHTSYELDQEASKPVDDGLGSTGRIGSYSHSTSTDSTTSTTPDVSPSLTSFILGNLQSKASHK